MRLSVAYLALASSLTTGVHLQQQLSAATSSLALTVAFFGVPPQANANIIIAITAPAFFMAMLYHELPHTGGLIRGYST